LRTGFDAESTVLGKGALFISLPSKKRSKKVALYKLLVSSAMLLKRGEKFFSLIPFSTARLRRSLTKGMMTIKAQFTLWLLGEAKASLP